jgi:hypothetical protein
MANYAVKVIEVLYDEDETDSMLNALGDALGSLVGAGILDYNYPYGGGISITENEASVKFPDAFSGEDEGQDSDLYLCDMCRDQACDDDCTDSECECQNCMDNREDDEEAEESEDDDGN